MGKVRTLYVSDLDGTLLRPDARISSSTAEILNRVIAAGELFTIATARTPATVAPILADLDLRLPAVVMTGTALWNKQNGEYSDIHYIDDKTAHELVGIYRTLNFPTFLYTLRDNMINIYHIGRGLSEIEQRFIDERRENSYKRFFIPPTGDSELPGNLGDTILFYGMQPDASAEATHQATSRVAGARTQKYHDFYGPEIGILEAFSPLSTKARAILEVARRVSAERIVAFGDNLNDIPMLDIADVGVAMENAVEEVKEKADIVIGPNTEDSVARFILHDIETHS